MMILAPGFGTFPCWTMSRSASSSQLWSWLASVGPWSVYHDPAWLASRMDSVSMVEFKILGHTWWRRWLGSRVTRGTIVGSAYSYIQNFLSPNIHKCTELSGISENMDWEYIIGVLSMYLPWLHIPFAGGSRTYLGIIIGSHKLPQSLRPAVPPKPIRVSSFAKSQLVILGLVC